MIKEDRYIKISDLGWVLSTHLADPSFDDLLKNIMLIEIPNHVVEGVLVPKEPTEAMIKAAELLDIQAGHRDPKRAYRAMLQAAQEEE